MNGEEVVIPEAAPVETPAPEVESTAEQLQQPAEQAQPEDKPTKAFTEDDVNKIVKKRLAQESRRLERVARAEAETAYLRQQLEAKQKSDAPQPQGEPKVEDFPDYDSYIRAQARYEARQELASLRDSQSRQQQEYQQQQEAQSFQQRVQAKMAEGSAKYDDFNDVVSDPNLHLTQPMIAAMAESDIGHDVAYYLGNHPEEAARIAKLAPAAQIREIVKLESKVNEPPKTTQAPPPIKPSGQAAKVDKDPSEMSFKEFSDWRRKVISRRR